MKTPVLKPLLNKVPGCKACNFAKKRIQHSCFPVNIAKFLRAPILKNIYLHTAASEVTLGSDCLVLPFWTVAFKTILT